MRVTIDFFVNHSIGNYPCSQKVTCTNIRFNCYSSYTICFKFTGTNGLEDLEEGAEKDDGMGVWWRWFSLELGLGLELGLELGPAWPAAPSARWLDPCACGSRCAAPAQVRVGV